MAGFTNLPLPSGVTATDQAAWDAAIVAVNTAGYGCIVAQPGVYRLNTMTCPSSGVEWELRGAGAIVTIFHIQTDAGDDAAALAPESSALPTMLRDFCLRGPGNGSAALGTSPCGMNGIRASDNVCLSDVVIEKFHSGLQIDGNHQHFTRVKATTNYFNVEFTPGSTGNQSFTDCDFAGSKLASVAVDPDGIMEGVRFTSVHFGFGPVGVYRDPSVPASKALFNGVTFDDSPFEGCGNAVIYAPAYSDTERYSITGSGGTVFRGCTNDTGYGNVTYQYAGLPHDWEIVVARTDNWRIEGKFLGNVIAVDAVEGGIYVDGGFGGIEWTGAQASIAYFQTVGTRILDALIGGANGNVQLTDSVGGGSVWVPRRSGYTSAAHDLIYEDTDGNYAKLLTAIDATHTFSGVVVIGAAHNDMCLVQVKGDCIVAATGTPRGSIVSPTTFNTVEVAGGGDQPIGKTQLPVGEGAGVAAGHVYLRLYPITGA